MNTKDQKVMMTISVAPGTRQLMHKYGGQRGVGRFLSELLRKYDTEEVFGSAMVITRLDRIEQSLIELLDRKEA